MISLVVTRGFGNGTLIGDIANVVTAGYSFGEEPIITVNPKNVLMIRKNNTSIRVKKTSNTISVLKTNNTIRVK